jgi:hypothetical protein
MSNIMLIVSVASELISLLVVLILVFGCVFASEKERQEGEFVPLKTVKYFLCSSCCCGLGAFFVNLLYVPFFTAICLGIFYGLGLGFIYKAFRNEIKVNQMIQEMIKINNELVEEIIKNK